MQFHASAGQQQRDRLCSPRWWLRHSGRHPFQQFPVAGLAASVGGCGTGAGALHCQSRVSRRVHTNLSCGITAAAVPYHSWSLAAPPPIVAATQLPMPPPASPSRRPPPNGAAAQQSVPFSFAGRAATRCGSVAVAGALPCQPLSPASPPPWPSPPPPVAVAVQNTSSGFRRS